MAAVVVDDHLLVDVLAETPTGALRELLDRSAIFTTSSWYYRAARAAHAGSGRGSISRRLTEMPGRPRTGLLDELPPWIGLIGPRDLVPVMAALETMRPMNLLAAEALAVALVVDGALVVSVDAPRLRAGAVELGVELHLASDLGGS